ncbi:hypothetical protein B0H19DRAFT_1142284 [Mycena capillaripes]|nr:hypothetical protein B0H19DRAFT_1142284 [Mycena capillaripes]
MDTCNGGCGKHADLRCSGCKSVRYCDVECQKKDWKTHKRSASRSKPHPSMATLHPAKAI